MKVTEAGIKRRFTYTVHTEAEAGFLSAVGGIVHPSTQSVENYPFLGTVPAMEVWTGSRSEHTPTEFDIEIRNEKYQANLIINGELIRRDQIDAVNHMTDGFAARANAHWDKLMIDAIVAGDAAVCWDGQFFFDTDHETGDSGTQDNDRTSVAAATTIPSTAEATSAILDAVQQIISFKDDKGEPWGQAARQFLIVVPVAYMEIFGTVIGNEIIEAAGVSKTNPLFAFKGFQFNMHVSPRITTSDRFWMFRTDAPGMESPLIRQQEGALSDNIKMKGAGSDFEYDNDKWAMGIQASRAIGYGNWHNAVQHVFT